MKTGRRRLEDFGARGIVSPQERFAQYIEDCKKLPRRKQGLFWLGVLDRDPDVRRLLELKERKRRY
jgi:hypothetical protein